LVRSLGGIKPRKPIAGKKHTFTRNCTRAEAAEEAFAAIEKLTDADLDIENESEGS
jgi:hypothetical protein